MRMKIGNEKKGDRKTHVKNMHICTRKLKSMHVLYVEHERSNTNDLTVSVKINVAKRKMKTTTTTTTTINYNSKNKILYK